MQTTQHQKLASKGTDNLAHKWKSGDRVVIQGLVQAQQFNGQPGTLLATMGQGQWQVKLDKDAKVLGVLSWGSKYSRLRMVDFK